MSIRTPLYTSFSSLAFSLIWQNWKYGIYSLRKEYVALGRGVSFSKVAALLHHDPPHPPTSIFGFAKAVDVSQDLPKLLFLVHL